MANTTEGDKDKKTESPPANPTGRTNLLLMVIAIVLGLLLIGLTVVATVMITTRTGGHAPAAEQHADAAVSEGEGEKNDKGEPAKAKPKEVEDKKKKDEPKVPAIYVTLEPPFVVNFPPGKPAKFLQITMEIMTRNQAISQLLKDNNPLLRNDLIMLFGSQEYEAIVAPNGKENLRTLALEATRGVVKKEGGKPAEVEAVYFTSVVMQ